MSISHWWLPAALVGAVVAGSACTQGAADDRTIGAAITVDRPNTGSDTLLDTSREKAAAAADEAKGTGEKTADASKNIAEKTVDKTKEVAEAVGNKTKEIVSATGEKITDGWITTKVSAKFVDETVLKGSDINVDTDDHVVTLKGTVGSGAAKARAAAIARGTEGVTRVVNQLVVM